MMFWRAIALMVAAGVSGMAHAHEFIAKPGAMTVQAGAELQIAGLSSHVFLISQELEAPEDVKVGFYADGKRTDIAIKPNEKTLADDGTVIALRAPPLSSRVGVFRKSGRRPPKD